jgi:hypothetical protein
MTDERYLEVVEGSTGHVVHRLNVTDKPESYVEKVMRGMSINIADDYFIRDTGDGEP